MGCAQSSRSSKARILAVSSGGGHWVELLRLIPAFEGYDLTLATVDLSYRQEAGTARFYAINDVTRWNPWIIPLTLTKLAWIFMRVRPDIVISTGALPGYLALRFAKLFSAKTIWVDSIANAEELSLSGKMAEKYSDFWLTQWPHLARAEGPHFRGAVI